MPWLRSPVFYGIVLLVLGLLTRVVLSLPEPAPPRTAEDMRRALEFQREQSPLLRLEPRYRPYMLAFILAGSEAEISAIKRVIDEELAAAAEIRDRGLAGVPEYMGERLMAVDLAMMALGGALLFRSLAFVLAVGFSAGLLTELVRQGHKLTGAPSEFYLAAVLAALIWSAAFWALRAGREGRLRLGP